jgi:hypothetical protein
MAHGVRQSVMEPAVVNRRLEILDALLKSPIPAEELIRNLGVYLLPVELQRFLFLDSLYRQFLNTPGVIVEFGCRWGQNLAILQSLRAIYEPFNYFRTIIGVDTFEGLHGITEKDGRGEYVSPGDFNVTSNYENYLEKVLRLKESQVALPQLQKFQILKGDAPKVFEEYLERHPETIVSFAYFDMDIYEPTAKCLRILQKRLTRGSILGFDELAFPDFPGETLAVQEVLGLSNIRLQRNQYCRSESFFVVE